MQISTFLPEVDRGLMGLSPHSQVCESLVKCMDMALYVLVLVADGNNYLLIAVVPYWCPGTPRNKGRSMVS